MRRAIVVLGVISLIIGGGLTQLLHSQQVIEPSDLKSLAEMYNSQKFKWVHLIPGTERFVLKEGPIPNFEASGMTPEQLAIFLGATATVAENGVKVRTVYVWESDTDRQVYIYTESGKIIASYPPPEGYDPYALSRERIEAEANLTQERGEWLIQSLDPTRVVLCVRVAEGPVPIAPPVLVPEACAAVRLPGGFGILGFDPQGPEPVSKELIGWSHDPPLGLKLTFENPGLDTRIPIWVCDGPDFHPPSYAWEADVECGESHGAFWTDEDSADYGARYYYTPLLDTTYVQAPSDTSLTVNYITTRDLSPTAYMWTTWANPPQGDRRSVSNIQPAEISYESYTARIYEAEFTGLNPDTSYNYCVSWSDGNTGVHSARTWPEQDDVGDFSFIAYGDNRGDRNHDFREPHRDVACLGIMNRGLLADADYPPFILHVGDLVNDGGRAGQWIPHFFRPAGGLLGRAPVFPCIGNHETNDDSTVSNYRALFTLPDVGPPNPDDAERWYSFNYGRCHFICLDTESDFSFGSDQYRWLCDSKIGDLVQAWRKKVSYGTVDRIFVWLHRPPYSSGPHRGEQQAADIRTHLVPKFEDYKVDMVFSGHEHLYERISKEGIQYVVTGGGGAPGAAIDLGHNLAQWGAVREEWCDYTRRPDDWRHYCVVSVSGADSDLSLRVSSWKQNLIDWWPREE